MKVFMKWGIVPLLLGTFLLLNSCTTIYRHHHHRPHRHRVVVVATQVTDIQQNNSMIKGDLAMIEQNSYGNIE